MGGCWPQATTGRGHQEEAKGASGRGGACPQTAATEGTSGAPRARRPPPHSTHRPCMHATPTIVAVVVVLPLLLSGGTQVALKTALTGWGKRPLVSQRCAGWVALPLAPTTPGGLLPRNSLCCALSLSLKHINVTKAATGSLQLYMQQLATGIWQSGNLLRRGSVLTLWPQPATNFAVSSPARRRAASPGLRLLRRHLNRRTGVPFGCPCGTGGLPRGDRKAPPGACLCCCC